MGVLRAVTIRIVFDVMLRARGVNTLLESGARNAFGGHHRPTLPILRGHGSRYGRTREVSAADCRTPTRPAPEGEGEKVRVDIRSTAIRTGLATAGNAAARTVTSGGAPVSGVVSAAGRP
ncbi:MULTISPECIES: hypothetical protein [Prauserella salsuginis group]|uniref:Uncharacterized protein n=1 Tax=Prauserella salsuginis TaxID=387889 RepID=A0ABW6G1Z4_9PSEU|nr:MULTISPECIES: hypothetical protein [Prauserella salsuginis group]